MKTPFLLGISEPESAVQELTETQTKCVGGGLNEECLQETVGWDGSLDYEFID